MSSRVKAARKETKHLHHRWGGHTPCQRRKGVLAEGCPWGKGPVRRPRNSQGRHSPQWEQRQDNPPRSAPVHRCPWAWRPSCPQLSWETQVALDLEGGEGGGTCSRRMTDGDPALGQKDRHSSRPSRAPERGSQETPDGAVALELEEAEEEPGAPRSPRRLLGPQACSDAPGGLWRTSCCPEL